MSRTADRDGPNPRRGWTYLVLVELLLRHVTSKLLLLLLLLVVALLMLVAREESLREREQRRGQESVAHPGRFLSSARPLSLPAD